MRRTKGIVTGIGKEKKKGTAKVMVKVRMKGYDDEDEEIWRKIRVTGGIKREE